MKENNFNPNDVVSRALLLMKYDTKNTLTENQTKVNKRILKEQSDVSGNIATGVGATVRDFAKTAFEHVGLDYQKHVSFDSKYLRPNEVDALIGDPSKATRELGWSAKTHWEDLAKLMVDADLELGKS